MKALIKIAPIVVIIACAGSLFFAFKVSGLKTKLKEDIVQITADRDKTTGVLTQTKKDLQDKAAEVKKAKDETAEIKASLEATKVTLGEKTKQAEDAAARATAAEQQLTDAKNKLASAEDAVKKLQEQTEKPEFKNAEELAKKLEVVSSENKVIGEQLAVTITGKKQLAADLEKERRTPTGLRGKVAVAKDAWNFIVLDIGNAEHVRPDTEFLVYRDSMFIAKARVTTVRAGSSIAELVPGYVKMPPRAGDVVIQGKL